jgi:hypothetical protein
MKKAVRSVTYVYCLFRGARPPRLAGAPPGLPGAGPLRTLKLDRSHHLVVASAPLDLYGPPALRDGLGDLDWISACALAHEAVVGHFARAGAVAPMKLFTLFPDDQRAVARLARTRPRMARLLARVDGAEEWGVRIGFDEARAVAAAGGPPPPARAVPPARRVVGSAHERARAEVDRAFAELARVAADARRHSPAQNDLTRRVVLDAVFLVRKPARARFRTAVGKIAARLSHAVYPVTLNGPSPPYSFLR